MRNPNAHLNFQTLCLQKALEFQCPLKWIEAKCRKNELNPVSPPNGSSSFPNNFSTKSQNTFRNTKASSRSNFWRKIEKENNLIAYHLTSHV